MAKPPDKLKADLESQAAAVQLLSAHYRDLIEDDESFRADLIDGETDFYEAVDAILEEIGELESFAAAVDERKKALDSRKTRLKNRSQSLRAALISALEVAGETTVKRPEATLTVKDTPASVEIVTEADIPSEYWIERDPKLDKSALLEALNGGAQIPGATLAEPKKAISIRRL